MRLYRMVTGSAVIVLCMSTGLLAETEFPYYAGKLTNSKNGSVHDFPLGVLSATGRLEHGARAILIKELGALGPAEKGGLLVGDYIFSIEGKVMGAYSKELDAGLAGPQSAMAVALDKACSFDPPKLRLGIIRDEKPVHLEIPLPPSPRYARSFPLRCKKTEAFRAAACQWLVQNQRSDGGWRTVYGSDARRYQAAICGLALLSSGNLEHLPSIRRAVNFVRTQTVANLDPTNPRAGTNNWSAAVAGIFLAEFYLATLDEQLLPDIQRCSDFLAARVSSNGRMGHGFEITYNGGGLTIVNVQVHLAWALSYHCGCKINGEAWNRSLGEVSKAMTKTGAVGYSSGARGENDASARTGAMATALVLSRQRPDLAQRMGNWLMRKNNRLRHAHANCSIGLIYGTTGIKLTNPRQLKTHLNNWLPYIELSRTAAGPAAYFGSKRNFGGDEYLGTGPIGNATIALMLGSPNNDLFVFGGLKKGWLVDDSTKTAEPSKNGRVSRERK